MQSPLTTEQKREISSLMGIITDTFPVPGNVKGASLVKAYLMAIDGYAFEHVQPVLKNIIIGKQLGFDGRWAPTSAQIGDWVASLAAAMRPSAIRDDGLDLVVYPIGGKPPPGYMALGEWNERRDRLAISERSKGKVVPINVRKMDEKS